MNQEAALHLALYHLVRCAAWGKPCAALLAELRRLYAAAGEPIPDTLRVSASPSHASQQYDLLDGGYTVIPTHELLHDPSPELMIQASEEQP